ncbi:hypothetical protein ACT3CE_17595 [Marinifilum sp. RC60d5]|uniref:hypothetical protein n=1 Tax=Marinifilum sp. RC60d5 TaxID=3458414 RepID=UPI00403507D4
MSTTTIIILSLLAIIILILIGYGTWSWAKSTYNYNIFNWGVILKGIIGASCLTIGVLLCTQRGEILTFSEMIFDTGTIILLAIGIGLFLWNFVSTLLNTNLIIAIISFLYQIILIYFVFKIIGKTMSIIKGE